MRNEISFLLLARFSSSGLKQFPQTQSYILSFVMGNGGTSIEKQRSSFNLSFEDALTFSERMAAVQVADKSGEHPEGQEDTHNGHQRLGGRRDDRSNCRDALSGSLHSRLDFSIPSSFPNP